MDSVMYAKKQLNDDIIILFSDIIYDEIYLKKLIKLNEKNHITIMCQKNWKKKIHLKV